MARGLFVCFLTTGLLAATSFADAATTIHGGRVPDELESVGGHGLGFGNEGVAAVSGQSSVRSNPAMMAFEKQYRLSAGYHWPTYGREFYQAGVVDSKTSSLAAGVLYSEGLSEFESFQRNASTPDERMSAHFDSPVKRRVSLGLAQSFAKLSAGMGGQFVEFHNDGRLQKGTSLSLGLAGLITSHLRFGLSAENLANGRVKNVSPRTYRFGFAYTMLGGDVTAHLDLKQRDRIALESPVSLGLTGNITDAPPGVQPAPKKPERMLTASFSARVQDLVRLMGAYGQNVGGPKRTALSGGVALVKGEFALSYLVGKPYNVDSKSHQAVNLSMNLSI